MRLEFKKTCFVVSEIGELNSESRKINDEKFKLIFEPVLNELGYSVIRADMETTANQISRDIIKRLIESDIVIADISDKNPNVFYELAIRNAVNKPIIIAKSINQRPPFDIADKRAIDIDMSNNIQWNQAKQKLKDIVIKSEDDPISASESIVTEFGNLIHLLGKSESNTRVDIMAELMIGLKDLKDEVKNLAGIVNNYSMTVDKTKFGEVLKFRAHMAEYKNDDPVMLVVENPNNLSESIKYRIFDDNHNIVRVGKLDVTADTRYFTIWQVTASSVRGEYVIYVEYSGIRQIVNFVVV